jgi:hypothetical protein
MQSNLKNEKGSALVIELILLAAVLVLAGFAFYNYQQHNSTPNNTVTPVPHKASPKVSPSPSASSSPAAGTFAIPQYGVHFNYSGDPTGLKYTYQTQNFVDVLFDSSQLDQAAGCTGTSGAIGTLSRTATKQNLPAADNHTDGQVANVGGYYYYFTHPQNPCSANPSGQAEETREESVLLQDLKTISAN